MNLSGAEGIVMFAVPKWDVIPCVPWADPAYLMPLLAVRSSRLAGCEVAWWALGCDGGSVLLTEAWKQQGPFPCT